VEALYMTEKKQPKRAGVDLLSVKQMLEAGVVLRLVSVATGYTVPELSVMCKVWGISRGRGGRRKAQPQEGEVS
jgi:hypothetical protein